MHFLVSIFIFLLFLPDMRLGGTRFCSNITVASLFKGIVIFNLYELIAHEGQKHEL